MSDTYYREMTDEEYDLWLDQADWPGAPNYLCQDTGYGWKRMSSRPLVPVEPCEHGNTGRHPVLDSRPPYELDFWCPGGALGGDDE